MFASSKKSFLKYFFLFSVYSLTYNSAAGVTSINFDNSDILKKNVNVGHGQDVISVIW